MSLSPATAPLRSYATTLFPATLSVATKTALSWWKAGAAAWAGPASATAASAPPAPQSRQWRGVS